jgi:tartrate dehydrogenase/decarboxylase/D-malate dehydrogenase
MTRTHRIAVLLGDGIGKETVPESLKVLDAAARRFGFDLNLTHYDWSCETYKDTGQMMPADGLEQLARSDSILLGAVGWPGVPDHVSLWGLLIPIRRGFDQYANVRPCKLMPGVRTPLAGRTEADIDFYVVRENTEGEYSSVGGRMFPGTDREFVTQQSVFTRTGVDRILKYAFELAMSRPKQHVTSATKSNGIIHTMPYWDERFAEMGKQYPEIRTDQYHIDILCAQFVQHPDWFDVVVGSNLFGDILSDLGPAVAGSIGIAPSANINPERVFPSMFEPVHGSAPDIAGKFICNPIGQIWSAALMLEHLGEDDAGNHRSDRNPAAQQRSEDPRYGRSGRDGRRRERDCGTGCGGLRPACLIDRRAVAVGAQGPHGELRFRHADAANPRQPHTSSLRFTAA